jgi:hypothetical protein
VRFSDQTNHWPASLRGTGAVLPSSSRRPLPTATSDPTRVDRDAPRLDGRHRDGAARRSAVWPVGRPATHGTAAHGTANAASFCPRPRFGPAPTGTGSVCRPAAGCCARCHQTQGPYRLPKVRAWSRAGVVTRNAVEPRPDAQCQMPSHEEQVSARQSHAAVSGVSRGRS